jgi:hypothetical protein
MLPPSRDLQAVTAAQGFDAALHFRGDDGTDRRIGSASSGRLPQLPPRDFFPAPPPYAWPGLGGPTLWPVTCDHPNRCGGDSGLWVSEGAGCGPPAIFNAGMSESSAAAAMARETLAERTETNGNSPVPRPQTA